MSESELYRQLGRKVKARREDLHLSQAQIASQLGLSRASMANLETGRQRLMLHHLYRLATALQLKSISELVPDAWVFDESASPVTISNEDLTPKARAGVEQFIRNMTSEQGRKRSR